MQIALADVQRALETLWTDMGALARNPLIEHLGLVDGWPEADRHDAYKRGSALIEAILAAAQRLQGNGGQQAFDTLDRVYGLRRDPGILVGEPDGSCGVDEAQIDVALSRLYEVLVS